MRKKSISFIMILSLILTMIASDTIQAATETSKLYPSKDKFVDSTGGYSSWQNGSSAWLYVGNDDSIGYGTERSALAFDLSQLPENVTSATLNLGINYVNGSALLKLEGSFDDSWSDTGTGMPVGATVLHNETLAPDSSGSINWKSLDVSNFTINEGNGDGIVSFLLTGNTSGTSYFSFHASEDAYYKPYLEITYTVPTLSQSVSDGDLTEDNLSSKDIILTLSDTTFIDSTLSLSNFSTSNSNLTISSVTYVDSNTCSLSIYSNKGDFDSNLSFTSTIASSEINSSNSLTSNSLTIIATNDNESMTATGDGNGIHRMSESGEEITITLTGGVFNSTLNKSNWSLHNFPTGVSVGSINRIDSTHATLILSGNATDGGVNDITNAYISCSGNEYDDGSSTVYSSNYITISTLNDDPPVIVNNEGITLDENASLTLLINDLSATDPDSNDSQLQYILTVSPSNGQIEYVGNPGVSISTFSQQDLIDNKVIYSHDGSETTSDSFVFEISDGLNELTGQVFTISISPVNDTPSLVQNVSLNATEGLQTPITSANLYASDPDSVDSLINYVLTALPTHGFLENTASPGTPITSFTQQNLIDNSINYVHDGSESDADLFTFKLSDGISDSTPYDYNISVSPIDDPPSLTKNEGINVTENSDCTITSTQLNVTDVDTTPNLITYTITTIPLHGIIANTDNISLAITSFTQQDIIDDKITYIHDGSETISDSLTFDFSDETTTTSENELNITITPSNDPPTVLTNAGLSVQEGNNQEISNTNLSATDIDSPDNLIQFIITNPTNHGYLENTDNLGFSILTFTQEDLVNSKIQYQHDGSETLTDSFVFKINDGDQELTNQTFNITVGPVGDTPTLVVNTGESLNEGESVTITFASLSSTDVDSEDLDLIYTIYTVTEHGNIEFSDLPGISQTTFTQRDIISSRVKYFHDNSETLSDSFTFKVSDGGNETLNNTYTFSISPVNDSPSVSINSGATVTQSKSVTITPTILLCEDPDNNPSELTYTLTGTPTSGFLAFASAPTIPITSFTQQALNDLDVIYVHDGSNSISDNFSFKVSDSLLETGDSQFDISITPNNIPNRKASHGSKISKSLYVNDKYSLELNTIFEDIDGDSLTYKVSINGSSFQGISNNYSYTATNTGITSLLFVASDGIGESSDTYEVVLSVISRPTTDNTSSEKSSDSSKGPITIEEKTKETLEISYEYPVDLNINFNGSAFNSLRDKTVEVVITELQKTDFNFTKAQLTSIGNLPILDISVYVNGLKTEFIADEPIEIQIPLSKLADNHKLVAIYIDENNETHLMDGIVIDDIMSFTTNHLSHYSLMYVESPFDDIDNHWGSIAIEALTARNILQGTKANTASPDQTISTAEFITMVCRYFNFVEDLPEDILDISDNTWYDTSINYAKEHQLLSRSDDVYFNPLAAIKREDMMMILYNALRHSNRLQRLDNKYYDYLEYADASSVSSNAIKSVDFLVSHDIIHGNNNKLFITDTATRAEVAQMLYNLLIALYR